MAGLGLGGRISTHRMLCGQFRRAVGRPCPRPPLRDGGVVGQAHGAVGPGVGSGAPAVALRASSSAYVTAMRSTISGVT